MLAINNGIPLKLVFFLCLNLATTLTAGDDHQFIYSGFAGSDIIVNGLAEVTPNGLLHLTNGTAQLKGQAFHPTPLNFHEPLNGTAVQSFSAAFVFAIRSIAPGVSAHGLTFFISPTKNMSKAFSNQFLGLLSRQKNGNSSNHVFAVELDTVLSNDMLDADDNHVGIDINDLRSVKSHYAGYYDDMSGNFHNLTLASFEAMQVWVDYDGGRKQISVTLAPLQMPKPMKPLVSINYDLSGILNKDKSYVGFSASTGILDSHHYVLGWSFGLNKPAPAINTSKLPKLPRIGPKPRSKLLEIVLPVASSTFVLALVTVIFLVIRRKIRYAELREDWEVEFGPHRFSYKDLFHATEGFKNKHLLGIGGFGRVYKGVLQKSKSEVAVKRVSHESRQGMKEFIAEVVSMGRLCHKNIAQLLGYCRRKAELLLVYDYMPNGSLDKYLHENTMQTLDWAQRFRIIHGVASGLLYLHEDWEQVVIHRDIKASNVLLDAEMNGRLGDFGLARLYDHGTDPQTTHVVGTMGYIAPELTRMGRASTLTNVVAFGVFLLEVTCGRRPITQQDGQDVPFMLVDWVLEHWQKASLPNVVDTRLLNNYNVDEACLALKLGLLCSHPSPSARPNMRQVMQYLDGNAILPEQILMEMTSNGGIIERGANYVVSPSPPSSTSFGSITVDLSGGR